MPKPNLPKLKELGEKATPGPWAMTKTEGDEWYFGHDDFECDVHSTETEKSYDRKLVFPIRQRDENDAVLIVEMRNQLPVILEYIEELERALA